MDYLDVKVNDDVQNTVEPDGKLNSVDDEHVENDQIKIENRSEDEFCNGEPIPEVYKTQGTMLYSSCTGYSETTCLCSSPFDTSISNDKKSYLEKRNFIPNERLLALRKQAQEAIKLRKTFTIRGCFYSIRKSLIQRGWVEKLDIHRRAPVTGLCQMVMDDYTQKLPLRKPGESRRQHILKCERNLMSRFLEHMPIDFLWAARKEKTDWIDMARNPSITVNKFHKSPFNTKEGLCNILREFHWFFEDGVSETYTPRTYNVWSQDGLADFIENFRISTCISMLRFFSEKTDAGGIGSIISEDGTIPLHSLDFAISQCKLYVRSCTHCDIDEEADYVWEHDWDLFLGYYKVLTEENGKFNETERDSIQSTLHLIEKILKDVSEYWQQYNLDGTSNIWIVKPANKCRGRGILLMNDLKKIVSFVNPPVVNKGRYIVQKYIERPLTIYNCKFDIRQWFLVTSVQPLVVWMYKESYLRFSSQEFSLVNFHESVHLTNHAIQKRYKNGKRDERLPRENMWDCHTFQAYLRQMGKAEMWSKRIYPGMRKALIGILLASQDTMDRRVNTFELFGADFIVSEDCHPWLIEVNSSPDLGASTSVTARLCPQCLEDVIKVVIDYRSNPKANTGGFELIYRQTIPAAPAYLGLNLCVKGNQITPNRLHTARKEKSKEDLTRKNKIHFSANTDTRCPNVAAEPTHKKALLVDFLESIRPKSEKLSSISTSRSSSRVRKPSKLKTTSGNRKVKTTDAPVLVDPYTARDLATKILPSKNGHFLKILNENCDKETKSNEYTRRHASCRNRMTTFPISEIHVCKENEHLSGRRPSKNNKNADKNIECIGSRCCAENLPPIVLPLQHTVNLPVKDLDCQINDSRKFKSSFPKRKSRQKAIRKSVT